MVTLKEVLGEEHKGNPVLLRFEHTGWIDCNARFEQVAGGGIVVYFEEEAGTTLCQVFERKDVMLKF